MNAAAALMVSPPAAITGAALCIGQSNAFGEGDNKVDASTRLIRQSASELFNLAISIH
jgi:hypothetical protein